MYVVHLNIASEKKKIIIYFVDNILGAPFGYGLHVVPSCPLPHARCLQKWTGVIFLVVKHGIIWCVNYFIIMSDQYNFRSGKCDSKTV